MDMTELAKAIRKHSGLSNEEIIDAGEHGADAGWAGFTYYNDTEKFYDKNENLIWELLEETADSQGEKPLAVVANFNTEVTDVATFKNVLAWFALEETGRWLAGEKG